MKNAKFIIMLQVMFLVGIFVFSASAVYQPGQGGPLAVTNLALRQKGLELASQDEYGKLQNDIIANDSIRRAAAALLANKVPENVEEVLNIPGADNPVYLVSILDTSGEKQFPFVMGRNEDSDAIAAVLEKDEEQSRELGIFVSQYSKEAIDKAIAAGKASSAGTVSEVIDQLIKYDGKNTKLLQPILYNVHLLQEALSLLKSDPNAPDALLALAGLLEIENKKDNPDPFVQESILNTINYIDPNSVVLGNTELFAKTSSSGIDLTKVLELQIEDAKEELAEQERTLRLAEHDQDAGIQPVGDITALTRAVNATKLEISALERKIEIRDAQNEIKAPSGGINQADILASQLEDAESKLVTSQGKLFDAIQEQNSAKTTSAYKRASAKVNELQAATDALERTTIIFNNMITSLPDTSIVAKLSSSGIIVIDDKNLSYSHSLVVSSFFANQNISDIERALGCEIQLMSDFLEVNNIKETDNSKTVIMSSKEPEPANKIEDATYIIMKEPAGDVRYLSIIPLMQQAKSVLDLKNNPEQPELHETLMSLMGELRPEQNRMDIDAMIDEILRGAVISEKLSAPLTNSYFGLPGRSISDKASSSGFEKEIQDAMEAFSAKTNFAFTNAAEILPQPGDSALSNQIKEAYESVVSELESIKEKDKSPETMAAVAKELRIVKTLFNTMTVTRDITAGLNAVPTVQDIAAKDADVKVRKDAVIYNDKAIEGQQEMLLRLLGTNSSKSLAKDLSNKLGCDVKLLSQCNENEINNANTIVISPEKLDNLNNVKWFIIEQEQIATSYVELSNLIVTAKGILGLKNIMEQPELYMALKGAIRSLSQGQLNESEIEAAITNYINGKPMVIKLPPAVTYDYDELEQLYRQALMVLIAA